MIKLHGMHIRQNFLPFNTKAAILQPKLLPVIIKTTDQPLSCINCRYINLPTYHFCTNCGYPIHPNKDNLSIYNLRVKRRKALENSCAEQILQARNALYILASFFVLGIFYLFSADNATFIKGVIMLFLCALYAGLGRWSLVKPFTAFLIGLMIILTFIAITAWSRFIDGRADSYFFYILFIQFIFIFYLWRGTKAAFQAEMLEEEVKI